MGKYIAVQGCTIQIIGTGAGNAQITSTPSTNFNADGKGVYTEPLTVMVSGYTASGFVQSSPVSGNISSTALNVKSKGKKVMLEGDMLAELILPGTVSQATPIPSLPVSLKIQSAGQRKVKGT